MKNFTNTTFGRWLRLGWLIVFFAAIVILIIASRPYQWSADVVLSYITVLRWPALTVLVLFLLSSSLPNLVDAVSQVIKERGIGFKAAGVSIQTGGEQVAVAKQQRTDGEVNPPPTPDKTSVAEAKKALAVALSSLVYEKTARIIFFSQVLILRKLQSVSPEGLTAVQLDEAFILHRSYTNDRIYHSIAELVDFLIREKYVEFDGSKYTITSQGKEFVQYLDQNSVVITNVG